MKKLLIALIVVSLLLPSVSALAFSGYVVADGGDSYVRTGPGLEFASIGVLYRGQALTFTGYYSVDYRGVVWFEVYWNYGVAWISSRFTSLY